MSISLQTAGAPIIRFGKKAVEDRNKSIEAGRRITYDEDMVYVKQVGEKDETERNAKEWLLSMRQKADGHNGNAPSIPGEWVDKFDKFYDNWQKGFEMPVDGFPVREWPILTPSQVANMHAMSTFTIEQVSQWTEQALGMFGIGGRELRDKARLWLQSGDDKAEKLQALQVENDSMKTQLSSLLDEVKSMRKEMQEDKPQRGRARADAAT